GVLYGVRPVVVAIVVVALWQLARTAVKRRWYVVIGAGTVAGYLLRVNVLALLAASALAVVLIDNRRRLHASAPLPLAIAAAVGARPARPGLAAVLGEFAKLGVIVFGSGYVLLAFLRADLVGHLHWLTQRQVLDARAGVHDGDVRRVPAGRRARRPCRHGRDLRAVLRHGRRRRAPHRAAAAFAVVRGGARWGHR